MLSKYKRRPESLEPICYAQFGKMYISGGKAKEGEEEEEEIQIFEKDQDDWENTQIEDPEDKFHTFLTEDDDYQFDLPNTLGLKRG